MESVIDWEYITGFCEGDGSVGVYVMSAVGQRRPQIDVTQLERDVLDYIQLCVGYGRMSKHPSGAWNLMIRGIRKCCPLLEEFSKYVVCEHFLGRLSKVLSFVGMPPTSKHLPTLNWFAGFFDAEGCSSVSSGSFMLHVGQKERSVLNSICGMFGGSVVPSTFGWQWVLYGDKAIALTQGLLGLLHSPKKRGQLIEHLDGLSDAKVRRAEYDVQHYCEHKAVQSYIDAHPEVVVELEREGKL